MNCGGCSPAFSFLGTKPSGSATPSWGFRYEAGSSVAVAFVEDAAEDDAADDDVAELLAEDEPGEPAVDEPAELDSGVALSGDAAVDPPLGARVTSLVTVTSDEVVGVAARGDRESGHHEHACGGHPTTSSSHAKLLSSGRTVRQ